VKAVIALIALAAAVVVLAVVLVSARDGDEPYRVRAIFDNAGFVIAGEDVKIAGVKVGKIVDLDVTEDFKAAVVLEITEPGYQDFRRDASCIVRPQSLIGERFVECKPTQPRSAGTPPPPELAEVDGERLLPV
jgi:ABC-type transporter Mla subunit MlaD